MLNESKYCTRKVYMGAREGVFVKVREKKKKKFSIGYTRVGIS